jgi:type II pantothenate kinase
VYFSREHGDDSLGGRLNFLKFETDRIDTCIDFMRNLVSDHRDNGTEPSDICVMATGGGAYKYYDKITEALGVEVIREDEMESLITGTAVVMHIHDQ